MAHGPDTSLKRCLGLRETVTITTGTVIGVGLFTVGANAVGMMGSGVIFATLTALAVSIYPALLYAEMGAALPYAGGTYTYAREGLGPAAGMLAGWNFIISMVSVASGEALAFSFYIRTLVEALGVQLPISDRALACLAVAVFIFLGVRGVEMAGRLQNGFLFFFWGVAIVWAIVMIPKMQFGNFASPSATGFLNCTALVWWCFAGFETCCAMGEEIRYPQINLPRALFLAPFIVFAVNGLFQWVLTCTVPTGRLGELAAAAAPYAQGMKLAGVTGAPLILLCVGIAFGGDFSTLNAAVTAPARYLLTMARDGAVPEAFGRLSRKSRTPAVAIVSLGALMILLICTDITYIASLSLFATLFYYIIGIAAAAALRKKRPDLPRPYRAPGIRFGAPLSILAYLLMMTQLDRGAVFAGFIWCVLGLWLLIIRGGGKSSGPAAAPPPELPTREERLKLDREYKVWKRVVGAAVGLVLLLYFAAFLI